MRAGAQTVPLRNYYAGCRDNRVEPAPFRLIGTRKGHPMGDPLELVEAAGVEPASASTLP